MRKRQTTLIQGQRVKFRYRGQELEGRFQFETATGTAVVFFTSAPGGCGFAYIPFADIIDSGARPAESFVPLTASSCPIR